MATTGRACARAHARARTQVAHEEVRVEGGNVRQHAADGHGRRELVALAAVLRRGEPAVGPEQRLDLPHPEHGAGDRHGERADARRELAAHLLAAQREPLRRQRARQRAVRVRALEEAAQHAVLHHVHDEHHACLKLRVREAREPHGRRVEGPQRLAQRAREAQVQARAEERQRQQQQQQLLPREPARQRPRGRRRRRRRGGSGRGGGRRALGARRRGARDLGRRGGATRSHRRRAFDDARVCCCAAGSRYRRVRGSC